MLNLQQNRKMYLTNPRNLCKLLTKFLPSDVFNFKKLLFFQFYPADLVNTKTTIPLRVGEQRKIRYLDASRYSPPLRGIVDIISQYDKRAPYNHVIGPAARVPTDIK